jgi:hypothetical protein
MKAVVFLSDIIPPPPAQAPRLAYEDCNWEWTPLRAHVQDNGSMETLLTIAAFVVVWTVLQSWVLPKFGVPT